LCFLTGYLNITLRSNFSPSPYNFLNKEKSGYRKTTADDGIKKAASVGFGVHTKENRKVERVEMSTDEPMTAKTFSLAHPRHYSTIMKS